MRIRAAAWLCVAWAALVTPASAQLPPPLMEDPLAISKLTGERVTPAPVMMRPEPEVVPAPRIPCGPGSMPEPGIQLRMRVRLADGTTRSLDRRYRRCTQTT